MTEIPQIEKFDDFTTIDWVHEASRENASRIQQIQVSLTSRGRLTLFRLYRAAQRWILISLIGIAIGVIAASINIVTEWLGNIKLGYCSKGFYLNERVCCYGQTSCSYWHPWSSHVTLQYLHFIVTGVFFAFVSAALVKLYAPLAAGSGISEIKCILNGYVLRGFLEMPILAMKALALPLTIASGLSVGKEGPSVHYAVCVGNVVSRCFPYYRKHPLKMREILTACTAAGVAVAFGSPMGGTLFVIEEISSDFQLKTLWTSYYCALVALATLSAMNPFRSGQVVLFSIHYPYTWHLFEVVPYLIIAVFGGVYGIFTIKWNLKAQAFRKKYLKDFPITEICILALTTGCLCYGNQFLRLDMTESMQLLFKECSDDKDLCDKKNTGSLVISLLTALIIRQFLVIISYGSKVPAGIFVPSMAIGALFGRLVGTILEAIHREHPTAAFFASCHPDKVCITPGTYSFLGAAAALSGIMNITVTVVVIMFELTGALGYILPTMIVVGTTKLISEKWGHGGIADQTIRTNDMPLIDNKEEYAIGMPVSDAMTTDLQCIQAPSIPFSDLRNLVSATRFTVYPVIDSKGYLIGYAQRLDILRTMASHSGVLDTDVCWFEPSDLPSPAHGLDFTQCLDQSPVLTTPWTPLEAVIDTFLRLGPRQLFVLSEGKLVGLLTRKDFIRYEAFMKKHL